MEMDRGKLRNVIYDIIWNLIQIPEVKSQVALSVEKKQRIKRGRWLNSNWAEVEGRLKGENNHFAVIYYKEMCVFEK